MLRRTFATAKKMISIGAKMPAGTLYENTPGGAVATEALFAPGKKVVIFGVPGCVSSAPHTHTKHFYSCSTLCLRHSALPRRPHSLTIAYTYFAPLTC